jgi:hypothetical protein
VFVPDGRSTAQRGYGKAHRRKRAEWEPLVEAGGVVCWRCRRLIVAGRISQPDGKGGFRLVSNWHLGHSDDRTRWLGPEHSACSVAAGARAGARKVNAKPKAVRRAAARKRPVRVFGPLSS